MILMQEVPLVIVLCEGIPPCRFTAARLGLKGTDDTAHVPTSAHPCSLYTHMLKVCNPGQLMALPILNGTAAVQPLTRM